MLLLRLCVCARARARVCACSYVVPGTGPSVVLSRHVLPDGSHWPVSDGVAQLLTGAGVSRVIVGHTPSAYALASLPLISSLTDVPCVAVGNCPSVIRSEQCNPLPTAATSAAPGVDSTSEGLIVFMCDTSYSNIAKIAGGGPRGKAVSELVVLSDTQTSVHGELETGDQISYVIDGPRGGDSHVGRDLSQQLAAMHMPTTAAESRDLPVYVAARLANATGSKAYLFWPISCLSTGQFNIGIPHCFGCC